MDRHQLHKIKETDALSLSNLNKKFLCFITLKKLRNYFSMTLFNWSAKSQFQFSFKFKVIYAVVYIWFFVETVPATTHRRDVILHAV